MHLTTAVQYNFEVIYAIIAFQKKIFNFLLHNICSTSILSVHIQILHSKQMGKLYGALM